MAPGFQQSKHARPNHHNGQLMGSPGGSMFTKDHHHRSHALGSPLPSLHSPRLQSPPNLPLFQPSPRRTMGNLGSPANHFGLSSLEAIFQSPMAGGSNTATAAAALLNSPGGVTAAELLGFHLETPGSTSALAHLLPGDVFTPTPRQQGGRPSGSVSAELLALLDNMGRPAVGGDAARALPPGAGGQHMYHHHHQAGGVSAGAPAGMLPMLPPEDRGGPRGAPPPGPGRAGAASAPPGMSAATGAPMRMSDPGSFMDMGDEAFEPPDSSRMDDLVRSVLLSPGPKGLWASLSSGGGSYLDPLMMAGREPGPGPTPGGALGGGVKLSIESMLLPGGGSGNTAGGMDGAARRRGRFLNFIQGPGAPPPQGPSLPPPPQLNFPQQGPYDGGPFQHAFGSPFDLQTGQGQDQGRGQHLLPLDALQPGSMPARRDSRDGSQQQEPPPFLNQTSRSGSLSLRPGGFSVGPYGGMPGPGHGSQDDSQGAGSLPPRPGAGRGGAYAEQRMNMAQQQDMGPPLMQQARPSSAPLFGAPPPPLPPQGRGVAQGGPSAGGRSSKSSAAGQGRSNLGPKASEAPAGPAARRTSAPAAMAAPSRPSAPAAAAPAAAAAAAASDARPSSNKGATPSTQQRPQRPTRAGAAADASAVAKQAKADPDGGGSRLSTDPATPPEGPAAANANGGHSSGRSRKPLADAAGSRTCHCKKSMCLKLYCDCFSAGMYCSNCSCAECMNKPENADTVMQRRVQIQTRDPDAFQRKIQAVAGGGVAEKARHMRGCNCRRSHCLKKYCECYQGGVKCGDHCKCLECQNMDDHAPPPASGRGGGAAKAGLRARTGARSAAAAAVHAAAQQALASDDSEEDASDDDLRTLIQARGGSAAAAARGPATKRTSNGANGSKGRARPAPPATETLQSPPGPADAPPTAVASTPLTALAKAPLVQQPSQQQAAQQETTHMRPPSSRRPRGAAAASGVAAMSVDATPARGQAPPAAAGGRHPGATPSSSSLLPKGDGPGPMQARTAAASKGSAAQQQQQGASGRRASDAMPPPPRPSSAAGMQAQAARGQAQVQQAPRPSAPAAAAADDTTSAEPSMLLCAEEDLDMQGGHGHGRGGHGSLGGGITPSAAAAAYLFGMDGPLGHDGGGFASFISTSQPNTAETLRGGGLGSRVFQMPLDGTRHCGAPEPSQPRHAGAQQPTSYMAHAQGPPGAAAAAAGSYTNSNGSDLQGGYPSLTRLGAQIGLYGSGASGGAGMALQGDARRPASNSRPGSCGSGSDAMRAGGSAADMQAMSSSPHGSMLQLPSGTGSSGRRGASGLPPVPGGVHTLVSPVRTSKGSGAARVTPTKRKAAEAPAALAGRDECNENLMMTTAASPTKREWAAPAAAPQAPLQPRQPPAANPPPTDQPHAHAAGPPGGDAPAAAASHARGPSAGPPGARSGSAAPADMNAEEKKRAAREYMALRLGAGGPEPGSLKGSAAGSLRSSLEAAGNPSAAGGGAEGLLAAMCPYPGAALGGHLAAGGLEGLMGSPAPSMGGCRLGPSSFLTPAGPARMTQMTKLGSGSTTLISPQQDKRPRIA